MHWARPSPSKEARRQGLLPEKPAKRNQYLFLETLQGLVRYHQEKAEEFSDSREFHRTRIEKYKADEMERRYEKLVKSVVLRSDYENNWKEALEQGIANIQRLECLSDAEKKGVIAALRAVKFGRHERPE